MFKRTLIALGLGLALLGGVTATAHAGSRAVAHPAAVHADLTVSGTGAQTADTDPNAPCAIDPATGTETGDCQNSQNTAGPEDNGGASSDGDNVQQGNQSSPPGQ